MPPITCDFGDLTDASKWIVTCDKAIDCVDTSSYSLCGVEGTSSADCAMTSNLRTTSNSFVSSGCDDTYLTINNGSAGAWSNGVWRWNDVGTDDGVLSRSPLVYHADAGTYITAYSSMDSYDEPLFCVKRRRKINIRFTV